MKNILMFLQDHKIISIILLVILIRCGLGIMQESRHAIANRKLTTSTQSVDVNVLEKSKPRQTQNPKPDSEKEIKIADSNHVLKQFAEKTYSNYADVGIEYTRLHNTILLDANLTSAEKEQLVLSLRAINDEKVKTLPVQRVVNYKLIPANKPNEIVRLQAEFSQ